MWPHEFKYNSVSSAWCNFLSSIAYCLSLTHTHTLANAHSKFISTFQWAHTNSLKADKSYSHMRRKQSAQLNPFDDCCVISPHEFISSPLWGDQTSPVHYVCPHRPNWNWKCYVPLRCSPNRPTLSNQTCEAITNQSRTCRWILKCGGGGRGGNSGCECLYWGVSASWKRCWREVKPNRLTNYRCLFLALPLCFTLFCLDEGTEPWQIKRHALLRWLGSKASNQKQLGAKWEQPRWYPNPTV